MATEGSSRSKYTPEQRAEALELYVKHGPAEASRRCGVPSGTIRQWALRGGVTRDRAVLAAAGVAALQLTWQQRRAEVRDRAGQVAVELLERAAGSTKHREVRDLMGSFAIAVDKAQLLDGAPTARVASEHEHVAQVKSMRDELKARREAKAA